MLFLLVGVLTTVQYVYNIMNMPYLIYAMRRYVPIVIPMLLIYAAYALVQMYRARPQRGIRFSAGVLTIALLIGLGYQSRLVVLPRDFFGAVTQLAELNGRLRPDAIVLMAEPSESALSDNFGVPLRFIFGHDIATLHADNASAAPFLDRLLTRAAELNRPVQVLALNPIPSAINSLLSCSRLERSRCTCLCSKPATIRTLQPFYQRFTISTSMMSWVNDPRRRSAQMQST